MNRKAALALLLAASAAAGNAFADDITVETVPFASTASRAEVVGQLAAFRASGANPWALEFDALAGFKGTRSRAQVTAEYLAERDKVAAFTGEDSGSGYLAQDRDGDAPALRLAGQPAAAH